MSLPLTRRFAQAALLLGAAAAPLIGTGTAHAAVPQQARGGLTTVDGAALGESVDSASQQATGVAGQTGAQAMKTTLPTTGRMLGTAGRTAAPAAQQTAADAADSAGRILGQTAESAGGALPGTEALPLTELPNTGALPTAGLPTTDQLPLKSLPLG